MYSSLIYYYCSHFPNNLIFLVALYSTVLALTYISVNVLGSGNYMS